jgi:outer membrane lipoprotein SlyB
MKRIVVVSLVLLSLGLALSGCAGTDWSRNIYQGIQHQHEVAPAPTDTQPAVRNPDYEQYRRDREALKDTPAR